MYSTFITRIKNEILRDQRHEISKMYNLQYLVSGCLSAIVSIYIFTKRPKTFALKSLLVYGLVTSLWAVSVFLARTAIDAMTAANYFTIVIFTSHLGLPLYLLTILNVRERRSKRILVLILVPAVAQTVALFQGYFSNYEFFPTELGWFYRVVGGFQLPLIVSGVCFLGYLASIVVVLSELARKTAFPLLRRKYTILLVSFTFFQAIGTTLTNALIAFDLFDPRLGVGGALQFLTFLSIWYALSLREREMPLSLMEAKDFPQIYSSFLTVYYNSVTGSHLGEEAFRFTDFLRGSNIEGQVSIDESKIAFKETEDLDLAWLINRNLSLFAEGSVDNEVLDQYLRVLNAAERKLGWRLDEVVKDNEDLLKKADLIYGISEGRLLEKIAEDASLKELDDIDACLKIYKRILLPIIGKLLANDKFRGKLSEYYITEATKISDYGEISIDGVRERLLEVPKDDRLQIAIERFNSILSLAYEELLMDPNADVEGILEKLMLVLTLNKDRAIALGVYPTLLGTLATKIPKAQIHELYSDFLEELVEERTRELKEAQDSLLKSQRLAVIGEAAAMVGHDLRNPLQSIVNTLYLAQKKLGSSSNKDLENLLRTISEQVEYMNKIVSDLQDYSRPVKTKLIETDLQQLLNGTLSAIRVPEDVRVSVEIEDDMDFPKLLVDPQLMKRVFVNLATNAIQAMPRGGQLRISTSRTGETVVISFQDTGVGISEENLDKMFQPLFTTKAKGQGLGLAVCKRLVEAHGGKITVEGEPGRGATFTIEIPSRPESQTERTLQRLPQMT